MCGITLVFDHGRARTPMLQALAVAHAMQAHRGPDGEGWLLVDADLVARRYPAQPGAADGRTPSPRLGVAFQRLCVQDLSDAAAQPLGAPDGRQWIVLNGEIYNHDELRERLRARGHAFHTCSDTEVALAAYREWGPACFERFDGMWAILIVDLARGRLVGSRDRLGIKPLFFTVEPGRLSFASEPAALACARGDGPHVEPVRFLEFLRGMPPGSASLSFFRDVHPVPAATVFEIDLRNAAVQEPEFRSFWELAASPPTPASAPPYGRAVEQLRDLVRGAVQTHMGSAVPVGCLLSGGLDSSFVASTMAARAASRSDPPVSAYSLVYEDPEMSEWPYIRAVVAQAGLASHSLTLTPATVWDSVDAVVRAQGQPLLGQEVIAQYQAYRLARHHGAIVVLEGQGADELLAGLPGYAAVYLRELLHGLELGALARESWAQARRYGESPFRILRRTLVPRWLRRRRGRHVYSWLDDPPRSSEVFDADDDPSMLNQYLYRLVRRTNLPAVLSYQDRSAMAHGVESRVPFLDHRLVEFCFSLPASYKVRCGLRKRILLDAARGVLPELVLHRTDKKRFISKDDWMPLRRDYGRELSEMARSPTMLDSPYLRGRAVAPFVDGFLAGRHDDALAVWRLYTAWRWLEAFRPA